MRALVDSAILQSIGIESASLGSAVKDLELSRLGRVAYDSSHAHKISTCDYAAETRMIKHADGFVTVTPFGKLVLELPARDALRWVLTVEATQSRGAADKWRLSRSSAAALVQTPKGNLPWGEGVAPWPASWESLIRLSDMDVLRFDDDTDCQSSSYELLPEGRSLLEEIAARSDTPFAVLAEALLQDETSAAVGRARPRAAVVQSEGAAAAITRHARMVAHEIRNALVPIQSTLEQLYRDAQRKGEAGMIDPHRRSIDTGVDRIFQFISEIVSVAERGAEPAELFDIASALEDAIAAIKPDLQESIPCDVRGRLPAVFGIRRRFVLAIINLLRNSAQARGDGGLRLEICAELQEDVVVVIIDDNGPGVPLEHRVLIFEQGLSLRAGGSGQGLALVPEVVENEMRGRVACKESPLGGARFELAIPVSSGRRAT